MSKKTLLYAWAVPAFTANSPVDHTWVTTYDNRVTPYGNIEEVGAAGESCWYCWGSFHAAGGTPNDPTGFMGQQSGDRALAQCLVQANADSQTVPAARDSIFTYGVDGVCHQLANKILYSTGDENIEPLGVKRARGYMASVFIYDKYGLQQTAWQNEIAKCGGQPPRERLMAASEQATPVSDDFEAHARDVLKGDDPKLLGDLLALRADVQRFFGTAVAGYHSAGCRRPERSKSAYAGASCQAARAAEIRGDIRVPTRSENRSGRSEHQAALN
jgi:hypothetical protein